jgi:hypothetical protein
MPRFGQYSLISYIHELRGERINLGVIVWHPVQGCDIRLSKSLSRVRMLDEDADIERLKAALGRIEVTVREWRHHGASPLPNLAHEFRHALVVEYPLNARIQDPAATVERLASSLLAPEPYRRPSNARRFSDTVARCLRRRLEPLGVGDLAFEFDETATFQPVRVTASYTVEEVRYVWRTVSFATVDSLDEQLTLAKAVHTENADLKALDTYRDVCLWVAAQMPKPRHRQAWTVVERWLNRASDRVETFVDTESVELKMLDDFGLFAEAG